MNNGIKLERAALSASVLESVISLHRANSKTLGFFPKGAFEEHAKLRQLVVALDDGGNCLGDVLYRVARGRASVVHLCVSETARGKGIARLPVDRLKQKTKSLEGSGLYCQRDYDVNHIGSKFGFEAVNSKTGRGFVVALNPIWKNQLNTIKRNSVEKCRQFGRRFARRCRGNPGARD
ncbi:MAG: hypothetical protein AAB676_19410 [Verrucomicrobiota bacterium]